jgi:hypothetical protein
MFHYNVTHRGEPGSWQHRENKAVRGMSLSSEDGFLGLEVYREDQARILGHYLATS